MGPSSKLSNPLHSDPLIKSTSEEDFSNRNSTASVASPGYYSDRPTTHPPPPIDDSPFAAPSTWSQSSTSSSSSPYTTSPWHSDATPLNPFSNSSAAETNQNNNNHDNDENDNDDLFPPGTGLVGSLVREEGHIYSLAAAAGLLYTGSDSKNIRVWKDQKEYSGFKASSGLVKAIVLSGDRIFTGHQDGKIRVWRISPQKPKIHKRAGTLPRLKDFLKSSINPNNYVDPTNRRRTSTVWIRHSDAVSCLSLSKDGSFLYSGSWDRTVKVWRVADSRCLESVAAHEDAVNAVVAAADDGMVFSGSADGTVKVWRRELTGKGTRHAALQTLLKQECAVTALAVNALTSVVYCGSSDGAVNFWDQLGGRQLAHGGALQGHKAAVLCLAAAGSLLFAGSADKTISVWRRDGGGAHSCVSVMTGHAGPVKCLAVEADSAAGRGGGRVWVVYSGSLDKSVKVWKVADHAAAAQDQPRHTTGTAAY